MTLLDVFVFESIAVVSCSTPFLIFERNRSVKLVKLGASNLSSFVRHNGQYLATIDDNLVTMKFEKGFDLHKSVISDGYMLR